MGSRIGIIAGAGRFPFHVADAAKRQGLIVVAVGIRGWVDPALAQQVDAYEELGVGQLRQLLDYFTQHQVHEAIMAGKVTKEVLLGQRTAFDPELLTVLGQLKEASVEALLGAVATRLADAGITLLDSSTLLKSHLCPVGVLTLRKPTVAETEDIRVGQQVARALASLDVGQTVVVKGRVIVAVEALEGTDATIRRAHQVAGSGLVVVKVAAAHQDRRFDLPTVGVDTIKTLHDAQVSCLALEAGTTLLLDRETLIAAANAANLCLVGIAPSSGSGTPAVTRRNH